MSTLSITRSQAVDSKVCPSCKSNNIDDTKGSCMCRIPGHSCWSYPVCGSCGFTAGNSAANSDGGIWIPFDSLSSSDSYQIISKEIK